MEENDEEEKESINIELNDLKADPENDENAIDFDDRMDKKKTRKIMFWLTS